MAAAGGASLAAHIHLDDADDAGTWRNALDFEPFTRRASPPPQPHTLPLRQRPQSAAAAPTQLWPAAL